MELFREEYSGESLCDVERDVMEAFDERYNPIVKNIPKDKYNMSKGIFTITITWEDDE